MAELRWVLLGLGVVLVAGVYLWGRGYFRHSERASRRAQRRAEPHISSAPRFSDDERGEVDVSAEEEPYPSVAEDVDTPVVTEEISAPAAPAPPEKIVTIRFIPKAGELSGVDVVLALREEGLEHGRYGIFHLHEPGSQEAQFSVASLTEPGSFDLHNLAENPLAGMSFFLVLPGAGDPVARFDAMVHTARELALKLDAELFDDRGSSWSIQRERYVREEVIRYRHQLVQTEVVGNAHP